MAIPTRQYTYADGETINPDENNANENALFNALASLDNDNMASDAGIEESKLAFDTSSGHDHDGINSKAIPKGLVFTVTGTLTTGTSVAPLLVATGALTISKVYVNVKTAPMGASIIVDINKNGTSIWNTTQANRATIAASATSGTQTSFDTTSIAEGDVLTLDIDQVGSSTAGADITVTIKA
jgi:hypothetical protein